MCGLNINYISNKNIKQEENSKYYNKQINFLLCMRGNIIIEVIKVKRFTLEGRENGNAEQLYHSLNYETI